MALTFLIGLASWFADGLGLYFILLGLGLPASWSLVGLSFLVFSFSLVIGVLSNLPGGLGVVELAMASLLTVLLGTHPELAVVATVLSVSPPSGQGLAWHADLGDLWKIPGSPLQRGSHH